MEKMEENSEGLIVRDGVPQIISQGKAIKQIEYHEKLNVIILSNEEGNVFVLDPTLGEILYQKKYGKEILISIGPEKVTVLENDKLGVRSDYNGVILLDSILQLPVQSITDFIQLEMNKSEVEALCNTLTSLDTDTDKDYKEIEGTLKQILDGKEADVVSGHSSVKKEKWSTIKVKARWSSLKSTFQMVVSELGKKNQYVPSLSIASSVIERINLLMPKGDNEYEFVLDKNQMFSEAKRLDTFVNWPHSDYLWAKADTMAEAGFYHNPSSNGDDKDDRAMCFMCKVCLVSWESSDEPWSEHFRHSPFCTFVRGEHTHNVPLSITLATNPAMEISKPQGKSILGKSSLSNAALVAYSGGKVVLFDISKQAKEIIQFEVTPKDLNFSESQPNFYSDMDLKSKGSWLMDSMDIPSPEDASSTKIELSDIALIAQLPSKDSPKPSILIGGSLEMSSNGEKPSQFKVPFLVLYSVTSEVFTKELAKPSLINSDSLKTGKGTKSENQPFEEDLLCYLSENDFMAEDSLLIDDYDFSNLSFPENNSGIIGKKKALKPPTSEPSTLIKNKPASVKIVQKFNLSKVEYSGKRLLISQIIPEPNSCKVIIIFEITREEPATASDVNGTILVFNTILKLKTTLLENDPIALKKLQNPISSSCLISENEEKGAMLACAFSNGIVQMFLISDLSLVHTISFNVDVTSINYCQGLEKLCVGTKSGSIEMISLLKPEVNLKMSEEKMGGKGGVPLGKSNSPLLVSQPLNKSTMKSLQKLTQFENIHPCFTANVPSCWVKIIQAQKERKHPQHLQHSADQDTNNTTLSWRLQRTGNSQTKKEHLFELTLPKSTHVGYVDLKFLLQMGCLNLPNIKVSLYRTSCRRGPPSSSQNDVDSSIYFGSVLKLKIPSNEFANEFLKSINAELMCTIDLCDHLDIGGSGGSVALTSPSLILTKGKSFYLHIKAKTDKKEEALAAQNLLNPPKASKVKSDSSLKSFKSLQANSFLNKAKLLYKSKDDLFEIAANSPYASNNFNQSLELLQEEKKADFIFGCDWLNEISITIRQIKPTDISNEHLERRHMIHSKEFHERLVKSAIFKGDEESTVIQNASLELLIWIASINLCGPQFNNDESGVQHQLEFIRIIEKYLDELILRGIILANRSTAKLCVKLILLCIDAIETIYSKSESFVSSVLKSIRGLLNYVVVCESAGALQWFFLLFNRVRSEGLGAANDSLLELLKLASNELNKRTDPLDALLRTRLGLYRTPFERDIFDIEFPTTTSTPSSSQQQPPPSGFSSVPPPPTNFPAPSNPFQVKDDFRDFLIGNPLNIRLESLPPKQNIQGLLEVEPLHFTLHDASQGTRLEKIDYGKVIYDLNPQPWPWVSNPTSMHQGEGSKKSEPDKMEQIMMLQKALKSDLNFMEENLIGYTLENPWKSGIVPQGYPQPGIQYMQSMAIPQKFIYNYAPPSSSYKPPPYTISSGFTTASSMPVPIPNTSQASSVPISSANVTAESLLKMGKIGKDDLRLLLSPWNQMQQPAQQLLVIDRMHSGARRYVVLDFGAPILLTDIIIPSCNDVVSLSIDIWLNREDEDCQRLVAAGDIAMRSLVLSDLQPPPICRFLKITVIGRYGMNSTKCRIPIGSYYGHTTILPDDLKLNDSSANIALSTQNQQNVKAHLSVLSYLLEDIECRYQIACSKLKRLLDPFSTPEISSLDHISYYLPKGRERSKFGLNSPDDQSIFSTYQECMGLQRQINIAKSVIRRLEKSISPSTPAQKAIENPLSQMKLICSDKIRIISEFLVESLLGISFLASNNSIIQSPNIDSTQLFSSLNQETAEILFKDICILGNGQLQLSTVTFLLRICGGQPWWGKFLASTIKNMFSSYNSDIFPQDRVFILLVFLGQKTLLSGKNTTVLESTMELLNTLLQSPEIRDIDMHLLGWVILFLCFCFDVNCSGSNSSSASGSSSKKSKRSRDSKDAYSRWDFIQGETALFRKLSSPSKISSGASGFKRRIQKKILAHKQKLEEMDASGYTSQQFFNAMKIPHGLSQFSSLGSKIESIKQKHASAKLQSSKHFKDLLQIRRSESLGSTKLTKDGKESSGDSQPNLLLNPNLCVQVAKNLGHCLLKMNSTCHSDIFLLTCKVLARIATSCRPTLTLGSIFDSDQLFSLILAAIGVDNSYSNSPPWVSHAIMCLVQDIQEGEMAFPPKTGESTPKNEPQQIIMTEASSGGGPNESVSEPTTEDMIIDDIDAVNANDVSTSEVINMESDELESDNEEVISESSNTSLNVNSGAAAATGGMLRIFKKTPLLMHASMSSISTAIDARYENGLEGSTELRLRMMTLIETEILKQALKTPIEIPELQEKMQESTSAPEPFTHANSKDLLSSAFERLFRMISQNWNCSYNIERILQLWLSFSLQAVNSVEDLLLIKPNVSLSQDSINCLISLFTKNGAIGLSEWSLLFQCLTLGTNQTTREIWKDIISNENFSKLILNFICGAGINLNRNQTPLVGPSVAGHFYNFLLRLRQQSSNTPWSSCLKELFLRILNDFLAGPFLNNFYLDAFNKFIDSCPDLSYENPVTVISIVERFAHGLHLFFFFPSKLSMKTTDIKPLANPPAGNNVETKIIKTITFENIMFRLVSFMGSIVSLPYKNTLQKNVQEFFLNSAVSPDYQEKERNLIEYLSKCENKPNTIADIILQMEPTMMRFLSVLSNPNGNDTIIGQDFNLLDNFDFENSNPSSLVDSVIVLFTKLCNSASNPMWTIYPLFKFISKSQMDDFSCPLFISNAFVRMILKVISNEEFLKEFSKLNCIEATCQRLVSSCKQLSNCPSFISIITQYIGRTEQKKPVNEPIEQDGLVNFAPLANIISTNFSAHFPCDVLLQATPPHRRARTPAWSYHFFQDESFLELIISLPCSILLKEIQIIPHLTSISTSSPSAVQVEISKDRSNLTNPIGPPFLTSGFSSINIQFNTKPEVAQTITLRLFKPKDSHTIGLSQIKLLGYTTFCDGQSIQDKYLESSSHWMYILDRAFCIAKEKHNMSLYHDLLRKAIAIPDILESCYSMYLAPIENEKYELSLPHVNSVLFEFSSLFEVKNNILRSLLGNVQLGFSRANSNPQSGAKIQLNAVVDLIFKLTTTTVGGPVPNEKSLGLLIQWIESTAEKAIGDGNERESNHSRTIVPEYVHGLACIIWTLAERRKADLSSILTPNLLKKLVKWCGKLGDCDLKAAIEHVICSICFSTPWLFVYLLLELKVVTVDAEKIARRKDKKPVEDLLQSWIEDGLIWENVHVKDLKDMDLTEDCLMTIGRAAQSPVATKMLQQSEFLVKLNASIIEFWDHYLKLTLSPEDPIETPPQVISPHTLIGIFRFYVELCQANNELKNWFGQALELVGLPLLTFFSTLSGHLKQKYFGNCIYALESALIKFFTACCISHPENQRIVSSLLCEIILKQKTTSHKVVFLHSMSNFCRRLLIQLLLENEKVIVHLKNSAKYPLKIPVRSLLSLSNKHPSMGVNWTDKIFQMSINSSFFELLKLIESSGGPLLEKNSQSSDFSILKREHGLIEEGLELIDEIQSSVDGNGNEKKATPSSSAGASSDIKRSHKLMTKKLKPDAVVIPSNGNEKGGESRGRSNGQMLVVESEEFSGVRIPLNLTFSTIFSAVRLQNPDSFSDVLVFNLRMEPRKVVPSKSTGGKEFEIGEKKLNEMYPEVFRNIPPVPSTIDVFSKMGGLGLLAKHLPFVYPETLRQIAVGKFGSFGNEGGGGGGGVGGGVLMVDKDASPLGDNGNDWVKIESADDFYEEMIENMSIVASTPIPKRIALSNINATLSLGVPPHSMAAFGLFLNLPKFSEVLLSEKIGAQCMLRLCLGVRDDAEGNDIFSSTVAKILPTLPFTVLRILLDLLPLSSDEGQSLRSAMIDIKALHFLLACIAIFTHQNLEPSLISGLQHELVIAAIKASSNESSGVSSSTGQGGGFQDKGKSEDRTQRDYWAKGTGFGTGSTAQNWDVELALQKKKTEEENVTCLLEVLSSYINPKKSQDERKTDPSPSQSILDMDKLLPDEVVTLIKNSGLFPAICGFLRNDSVLDMARHVPLYKSVLLFLRALVSSPQLLVLLSPWEKGSSSDDRPISVLLSKMKEVVENYTKRLSSNKNKSKGKIPAPPVVKTGEEIDDEGLALLIQDIKTSAQIVEGAVEELSKRFGPSDVEMKDESLSKSLASRKTLDERYIDEMRGLQFGFYEMIVEEGEDENGGSTGIRFSVPYHYENNVRSSWNRTFTNRLKRLAQESVTLSSSLPIAYGSTIFVRCCEDRLDVMKVLITGPSGTPYSNGCFEFDVFFPNDYPNSPMLINLETTGSFKQRVRFNPNLYSDGKVCLSILNTWHGRPEEKWNPSTSSLLPVLVAIQSLILNTEPYFNEPGYEKSRGTEQGEKNSREYNAGIQIATLEWAILEQLKNPSICFKDVIHRHFWIKRAEIIEQCNKWLEELIVTCKNDKRAGKNVTIGDPVASFRNNLVLLKKEFANMKAPEGLEDLGALYTTNSNEMEAGSSSNSSKNKVEKPGVQTEQNNSNWDIFLKELKKEEDEIEEALKAPNEEQKMDI